MLHNNKTTSTQLIANNLNSKSTLPETINASTEVGTLDLPSNDSITSETYPSAAENVVLQMEELSDVSDKLTGGSMHTVKMLDKYRTMIPRAQYDEANSAIATIRSFITHGSNHISDSGRVDFQRGNAIRAAVPIIALHNALRGINPSQNVFAKLNFLGLKKYGYGQCGELAQALFIHLVEKQIYPVDLFDTTVGGHSLIVIGRAPNSNPKDMTTWGDKAIICDAWTNQIYPASNFRQMQKENDSSHYNPAIYEALKSEIPPPHLNGELSIQYSVKTHEEAIKFVEEAKISVELITFFDSKIESDCDLKKDMEEMNKMLAGIKNSILGRNPGAMPAIQQADQCLRSLKFGLKHREIFDLKTEVKEHAPHTITFSQK